MRSFIKKRDDYGLFRYNEAQQQLSLLSGPTKVRHWAKSSIG